MTVDELMERLLELQAPEAQLRLEAWIVAGQIVVGIVVGDERIPLWWREA